MKIISNLDKAQIQICANILLLLMCEHNRGRGKLKEKLSAYFFAFGKNA